MWDFEHLPLSTALATRYDFDWMLPSQCADKLASGEADIGLVPIASLATIPGLRILPGCTIASKGRVRSLLLVRRANRSLANLRSVAADTASRTTLAYARILFHQWGNSDVPFVPMAADLDAMLDRADAAIVIGDPALMALEEQANRFERTGEELVYHDLAQEWKALTGLPFVSAVWGVAGNFHLDRLSEDFIRSRDQGLKNIDALVTEWTRQIPLSEETIRAYLTTNIHYVLDEECIDGISGFFRMKRGAGADIFLKTLEKVRTAVPGIALRTSFIVGFPGESPSDFQILEEFISEARFDWLGVFNYSDEEGSGAFLLDAKVPKRTIDSRQRRLMKLQQSISKRAKQQWVGRELVLLAEGESEETPMLWEGRTQFHAPEIDGKVYINDFGELESLEAGRFYKAEITEAHEYDVIARVVSGPL